MSTESSAPEAEGGKSSRRLAAILHADVVGYSRLMAQDEAGTLARLLAYRKMLYADLDRFGGRVVGTAGDAVLAVFDSVVDALAAATSIQEKLGRENANLPDADKLQFRIGLNLGDIIVEGGDVFGNGVNVAARTEALADPGGIAVSAAVREQVGNKLPVTFEDRGSHSVKNIATPLRVYAVRSGAAAVDAPAAPSRRKTRFAVLVGVGAVCALGLVAFVFGSGARNADPSAEQLQIESVGPQKPTMVVLPFDSRMASGADDYFGDGVTEDLIGALGRFSGLLVLSWSAVAPYKAQTVEVTQLSTDLGADYVVSGSIQRSDAKIRINVQLSSAATGLLIWSQRYDEEISDIFEVQDRLVRQLVTALAVRVTQEEEARVARAPTDSLTAYDLVLRGRGLLRDVVREANLDARRYFEQALEADPEYADAMVGLGYTHLNDLKFGWTFRPQAAFDRALALARRAVEADRFNAGAFTLLASTHKFSGQLGDAERAIITALELNPNNAESHAEHCSILMFSGQPEVAIEAADRALRIDPYPRGDQLNCPIIAHFMVGDYAAVLDLFERFPEPASEEPGSLVGRAAAAAMLGRSEDAARYREEALARNPFFDAAGFASIFMGEVYQQQIREGLRRAGFD